MVRRENQIELSRGKQNKKREGAENKKQMERIGEREKTTEIGKGETLKKKQPPA